MLTTIVVAVVAVAGGVVVGWLAAAARVARAAAERDAANRERLRSDSQVAEMRRRVEEAQQARAVAETRAVDTQKLLDNHKQFEEKFTVLAQRAFTQVNESLVQMNKQTVEGSMETKKVEIDAMLNPLREMVEKYRSELDRSEKARNESYGGLQEQIRALMSAQEAASREASRLVSALESPTARGSWGEISLRRCVELAGMVEYCDFYMQETIEGEDGRRLRPDMIVRLPGERIIAVDAKAQSVIGAVDEERRLALLRRHVEALSRKEYQTALGSGLDFVVMFVPGQQFLPADQDFVEFAAQRKVFVASPPVLIPLLRVVNAGWRAEKTEENAKRIHEAGVDLFNRFVRVMDLISEVGSRLGKTVEKYNEAIRSIDARLWPKGEEMQRMAGSGKELAAPEQLEAVPLQSSKLRLSMQSEEEGVIVPLER